MQYALLLVIYSLFSFFTAEVAKRKGRNPKFWAVMGFLFGIFALSFVAFLPKKLPITEPQGETPAEVPTLSITPDMWYYLDDQHTTKGPISFHRLQELIFNGELKRSSYIWHESMKDWEKLNENRLLLEKLLNTSANKPKVSS